MSLIKENGAPGRNTKGSIGDTYIDTTTGKKYICTFAFRDSSGAEVYDWKFDSIDKANANVNTNTTKPTPQPVETKEDEKIEESVADESEPEPINQSRKTNYSKSYKQNKN